MTNSKSTKRALVTSALSVFLCVAMLIGTTFAWFTDTASTSVNKIQAGTLDVALQVFENGEWVSAEDRTLDFVKAAGNEKEAILWEPGCTYSLPELRIVNNGKLALKYKVVITGINGDAKLNEVIDWKIGDVAQGTEQKLAAGATTDAFTISGTMQTKAGNEYQNLTIKGISISVVATQDTAEYDSTTDQYDKDAVKVLGYYDDVNNITLKSTVVDSVRVWNNLTEVNGYSARGHKAICWNQKANDEAMFEDCIFLCDVGNVYSVERGSITFKDCTFYGWVHFGDPSGATIKFENCIFTSNCDVKVGSDAESVLFENCTFEEKSTIVDSATMNAEYSYDGECGRVMIWSNSTFNNCHIYREVYAGGNANITKTKCDGYVENGLDTAKNNEYETDLSDIIDNNVENGFMVADGTYVTKDTLLAFDTIYDTVLLKNVKVECEKLVVMNKCNTLVLKDCDITIAEGGKLVENNSGVPAQICFMNVTINGKTVTTDNVTNVINSYCTENCAGYAY